MTTPKLKFIDYHVPGLTNGKYAITVTRSGHGEILPGVPAGMTQPPDAEFFVAGPRFSIDPQVIDSVFPPAGSLGDHENTIPHVALTRSTLPWERRADPSDDKLPWMALLLFDQSEDVAKMERTVALSSLPQGAQLEPGQSANDKVNTLTVPRKWLDDTFPSREELKYLVHVRQLGGGDGTETAIVMANRLPKASSSSVAHLVSLEDLLDKGSLMGDSPSITFVSLFSWRFACTGPEHSLVGRLSRLNRRDPDAPKPGPSIDTTFRLAETANAEVNSYLAAGAAPLRHTGHDGRKSVSWYHGPFSAGLADIEVPAGTRHASQNILYDAASRMFDVSYAAAWELGRWLTLRNTRVATEMYLWKRRHAQQLLLAEQALQHFANASHAADVIADLPAVVADWFAALRLLKNIPFHYLAPREDMLPPESIRFFRLDARWLEALIDGAFSIGRVSDAQADHDAGVAKTGMSSAAAMSGILLRSAAVSDWPELQCAAWNIGADPTDGNRMNILRRDVLAPGVLLCLVEDKIAGATATGGDGSVRAVDFFLRPEAMHHGFAAGTGNELVKTRRGPDGRELDGAKSTFTPDLNRRINIGNLANALKLDSDTPSNFGLAMIQGSDRVRVQVL